MKKYTVCSFPVQTCLSCIKTQVQDLLILALKLFLGITIISFYIPSAVGTEKIILHNVSPVENRPTTTILDQEDKRAPSLESWNIIHDITEHLFSNESNEKVKYQIKSLRWELKAEISSDNLSTLQIINFLKNKIAEKTPNPYKKIAAIRIMRELLRRYPLPNNSKALQMIYFLRGVISKQKVNFQERNNSAQLSKSVILRQEANLQIRNDIIQLMGELSVTYPLSEVEVLKLLNFLQKELSHMQPDTHIQQVPIQVIGNILEQYDLPEPDILKALNQIKAYLFHNDVRVRQDALQVIVVLLKTGKVSDPEKQTLISWLASHLNNKDAQINRTSALVTLNEFLKQNILSDHHDKQKIASIALGKLTDSHSEVRKEAIIISSAFLKDNSWDLDEKRKITFMIADKITDPNKDVQTEAITTLGALLSEQDVLSDPNDKREITFMIADRFTDPNEDVQKAAIATAGSLIIQEDILPDPNDKREITFMIIDRITDPNEKVQKAAITAAGSLITKEDILPDPNDKREITFMIVDQMTDPNGKAQKEAIIAVSSLISQTFLSDSEKSEIAYKITLLLLDDTRSIRTRRAASIAIMDLLISDFLLSEKSKIIQLLVEGLSSVTHLQAQTKIFHILLAAKKAGLPLDFHTLDKVTNTVSKPPPLGDKAETFVRELLKDIPLSDDGIKERLMIHIKMEQLLAERNSPAKEEPDQNTACQDSMLAAGSTKFR